MSSNWSASSAPVEGGGAGRGLQTSLTRAEETEGWISSPRFCSRALTFFAVAIVGAG